MGWKSLKKKSLNTFIILEKPIRATLSREFDLLSVFF